jgi:hypothetical protein
MKPSALRIERLLAKVEAELACSAVPCADRPGNCAVETVHPGNRGEEIAAAELAVRRLAFQLADKPIMSESEVSHLPQTGESPARTNRRAGRALRYSCDL